MCIIVIKEGKMTVYIDQYILVNTILNFVILRITKSIIKSRSSNPRLLVSSIAGALFAILMLFPQARPFTNILGKIMFSLILTAISFKSSSFKTFLKNLAAFYFVSFTLGGCAYAFVNLPGSEKYIDATKLLCITVFISYIILNVITSVYERHFKNGNLIHKLTITLNDQQIKTECFYDTGNNLKDPLTKKPVIIISIKAVKDILPQNFVNDFLNCKDVLKIYSINYNDFKLKLIPYHTVTDNGFILGFTPTKVFIDDKETQAIIGISQLMLSKAKSYNAIVNPHTI